MRAVRMWKISSYFAIWVGMIRLVIGNSPQFAHFKRQSPPLTPLGSPTYYSNPPNPLVLPDPYGFRPQGIAQLPSAVAAAIAIGNGQSPTDEQASALSVAVGWIEAADAVEPFEMFVPVHWLQVRGNQLLLNSSGSVAVLARLRGVNVYDIRFDDDSCAATGDERVAEIKKRIDFAYDQGVSLFRLPLDTRPFGTVGDLYDEPQQSQILTNDTYWNEIVEIIYHIANLTCCDNADTHAYVDLTLWTDPSHHAPCTGTSYTAAGVPSRNSRPIWEKIVSEFRSDPFIIFGLANEPGNCGDDATLLAVDSEISDIISYIRDAEGSGPPHLIKVPGLKRDGYPCCDRDLGWWVANPLTWVNIVYSAHYYDLYSQAAGYLTNFIPTLPVIVDELGPTAQLSWTESLTLAAWCEVQYPPLPYAFWTLASDPTADVNFNLLNITDQSRGLCGVMSIDSPAQYSLSTGYGKAIMAWLLHATGQRI